MAQTKELQLSSTAAEQTRPGPVYQPPVDIVEDTDGYTVFADMPGVNSDDLHVDLREGTLTIRGHCRAWTGDREQEVLSEFEPGTFLRQFTLPDAVEQTRIDASLVNGVLRLRLAKVEAARPRRIQVKSV